MQSLVIDIESALKDLERTIRGRYGIASNRATAEYAYRTALRREMEKAKADGMAATSLYDYCRGIDYIADLRCKRDTLQAQEDMMTDLIYFYRAEIRVYEGQMRAERHGL